MRQLVTLTAAAAFAVAFGFAGTAKAEVTFPFDGDLVGYWHFDTNAGAVDAVDGSGNGNTGDLKGDATRSVDIPDLPNNTNSVDLDPTANVDDFVEIDDDATLDVTGALTLAAWVKIDADTNTHQGVVAKWNSPGNDRSYEIVLLRISGTDLRPEMFINTTGFGSGNIGVVGSSGINPGDGAWHHVAGTFKSDPAGGVTVTDEVKVYLDGNLIGTKDAPDDAMIHDSSTPVLIGAENVAPTLFFNGKIDEVRIYDVALTAAQIELLAATFEGDIAKTFVSGNDPITISDTLTQAYQYTIEVTYNPTSDFTLGGSNVVLDFGDTLPAEWDLDPDCGVEACVESATSGLVQGTDIAVGGATGSGDTFTDGIVVAAVGGSLTNCSILTSTSGGGQKKRDQAKVNFLEPEFIDMTIVNPATDADAVCDFDVFAITDQNPASKKGKKGPGAPDQFAPTECPASGVVVLNEGVSAFRNDTQELLFTVGSLTLTCS